jgi:hypothetical protein
MGPKIQRVGHCGTHSSTGLQVCRSVAPANLAQLLPPRQAVGLCVQFPNVNMLISSKAHLADTEAGQQRGGL